MGMQQMGSQGDGGNNGKQSQLQPLARQNSMYSLTLDEVQNQLGDLGKPLSSMNLDELLKTVWTAEANQGTGLEVDGSQVADQTALQRQASLSLTGTLCKKTVDEVWRDIQQIKNNGEKKSRDRQSTLGQMTLQDFLVKAGVVAETSMVKRDGGPVVGVEANAVPSTEHFQQPGHWMQYPLAQCQHPQQNVIGVYMPGQAMQQPLHMGASSLMDVPFAESQVALSSPLMGTLSDSQATARKRGNPEDMVEKSVERRQKRMIKNRESAARSQARKQAYTNELENKVSRLEEENGRLRKQRELENLLPSTPLPEPKYQLRRASSAPLLTYLPCAHVL